MKFDKTDFTLDGLDCIVLLDRARNLLFDIIDEVWDIVNKAAIEMQIENKQEEIERLKWNFPIEENKAEVKKKISANREAIDKLNVARDKVELSFLYIKQGIQNIFNGILVLYGAVEMVPSSVILKGNGEFISKSKRNIMSLFEGESKTTGPSVAARISVDEIELNIKTALFFAKTMKELTFLSIESAQLANKEKADKALEAAVNTRGD